MDRRQSRHEQRTQRCPSPIQSSERAGLAGTPWIQGAGGQEVPKHEASTGGRMCLPHCLESGSRACLASTLPPFTCRMPSIAASPPPGTRYSLYFYATVSQPLENPWCLRQAGAVGSTKLHWSAVLRRWRINHGSASTNKPWLWEQAVMLLALTRRELDVCGLPWATVPLPLLQLTLQPRLSSQSFDMGGIEPVPSRRV